MSDRYCPHCGAKLVRGQRAVFGSKESEAKFARRVFCSMRCSMRAQNRKQRAKAKALRA